MGVKLWIKLGGKIFMCYFVICIRFKKLRSRFCICSASSGRPVLCEQSFSHWTFPEVRKHPASSCESRISKNWVVATMWFLYVWVQTHYVRQKFYKEINFLLLPDVSCKAPYRFGRIILFPSRKIKNYSRMRERHGFIPRRGNWMQKYSSERLSCSLCSIDLFLRLMLWTHRQKVEYWQHNGSKRNQHKQYVSYHPTTLLLHK